MKSISALLYVAAGAGLDCELVQVSLKSRRLKGHVLIVLKVKEGLAG